MKKAFTLVELLAVIIILGIIGTIVVIAVQGTINQNVSKLYETQVEFIEQGAKNYMAKNLFELPEDGMMIELTIKDLQDAGFLEDNIINPKTNKEFSDSLIIRVTNNNNNYIYELLDV